MSNANASIAVFNSSSNQLQIRVNNGGALSIAGAGPSQNWAPQQPNPNPLSFDYGYPSPNVFGGTGVNQVMVSANGSPLGSPLQVSIPQSGPISSLQLYIFIAGSSVSWSLLSGGQQIGSGTSTSYESS
jgi:hypothetical protein